MSEKDNLDPITPSFLIFPISVHLFLIIITEKLYTIFYKNASLFLQESRKKVIMESKL